MKEFLAKQNIKKQKGMTVLEVLIAVGIVAIILGGVVLLMINVGNYSSSAEARNIAVNYAQEAIDIVKNVRDNEYCSFFKDYGSGGGGRNYNFTKSGGVYRLVNASGDGFINLFTPGTKEALATDMKRRINIRNLPPVNSDDNYSKRITVTVKWQTKSSSQVDEYIAVTDIYKWKY